MPRNWASFIIRRTDHRQVLSYADACGDIVEKLNVTERPISSLLQLLTKITSYMRLDQDKFMTEAEAAGGKSRHYGRFRDLSWPSIPEHPVAPQKTTLYSVYLDIYEHFLKRKNDFLRDYPQEFALSYEGFKDVCTFFYNKDVGEETAEKIALCKIKDGELIYPDNSEALWSEINDRFDAAMDLTTSLEERKYAMADFYYLLSHACYLDRGNSTMARIALEYVAEQSGFDIPPCQDEVSLNFEALLSPHSHFRERFVKMELFDQVTPPEKILAWQREVTGVGRT